MCVGILKIAGFFLTSVGVMFLICIKLESVFRKGLQLQAAYRR